jgi:hypothetical protein
VVTIEAGRRTGIAAMLRGTPAADPAYASAGGSTGIHESGGFRPVRVVGELEGFKFTEGLKS